MKRGRPLKRTPVNSIKYVTPKGEVVFYERTSKGFVIDNLHDIQEEEKQKEINAFSDFNSDQDFLIIPENFEDNFINFDIPITNDSFFWEDNLFDFDQLNALFNTGKDNFQSPLENKYNDCNDDLNTKETFQFDNKLTQNPNQK